MQGSEAKKKQTLRSPSRALLSKKRRYAEKSNISTLNLNGTVVATANARTEHSNAAVENFKIKEFISFLESDGATENSNLNFLDPWAERVKITVNLKNKAAAAPVYCWINKENGKKYIGSGVNLYSRISDYFYASYLLRVKKFAIVRALVKYGMVNFSLIVLEIINPEN